MLGSAVIVLRESVEASLIVGIVAAATRAVPGRGRWLGAGIIVGLLGSIGVAASAGWITALADGLGQEIFNAAVLGAAVVMLAWHGIWMATHARTVASEARAVGMEVADGRRALSAVAAIVAVAILREGSETVLFLYGLLAGGEGASSVTAGGAIGLAGGAAIGAAMYFGLVRIPIRWFFSVTGALILLLAAGMAGQAARFLIQAGLLPPLADPLWDTSGLLPNDSALGTTLHALVGYDAQPAGMQAVFFLVALTIVCVGMRLTRIRSARGPR